MKAIARALGALLVVAVGLTGCADSTADPLTNETLSNARQVLHLALYDEPLTLDSARATDNMAFRVLGQLGEGLVRLDANGRPTPGVATDWNISSDGLTYTFHLRTDARWSDGSPLTAYDFEYAWKRVLDPKTDSPYAFMAAWLRGGANYMLGKGSADQVGIHAISEHDLHVTLEHPAPFFLEQMAFPVFYPVKQASVEKHGPAYGQEAATLVTNGPFILRGWEHAQSLQLEQNAHYWDRLNVALDEVQFQVVTEAQDAETLYLEGQLDRFTLDRDQYQRYKSSAELTITPELATGYLQYNTRHPAFAHPLVRQALTYAIDATYYAQEILGNGSVAATGYVPRGMPNGQGGDFRADHGDRLNRAQNRPQAKALLQRGLAALGLTELPPLHLLIDNSTQSMRAGEFFVREWKEQLGITVQLDAVPFKQRLKRTEQRDYEIVLALWGADYNDPMTFLELWTSTHPFNENGYRNSRYDQLIEAARREPDNSKRMQRLGEAEQLLLQDMPIGPLFFRSTVTLTKPSVRGWVSMPFSPDFDLKRVEIATGTK